jgi:hypothetical protein
MIDRAAAGAASGTGGLIRIPVEGGVRSEEYLFVTVGRARFLEEHLSPALHHRRRHPLQALRTKADGGLEFGLW